VRWPWSGPEIFDLWGVIRFHWALEDYFDRTYLDNVKNSWPYIEIEPENYMVKFYRYEMNQ